MTMNRDNSVTQTDGKLKDLNKRKSRDTLGNASGMLIVPDQQLHGDQLQIMSSQGEVQTAFLEKFTLDKSTLENSY